MSNQDKEGKIILNGIVIESLPDTHFRVQLEDGAVLLAYMSGKCARHSNSLSIGQY